MNNAGYAAGQFGAGPQTSTADTSIESLRKHFDINFFQQFALTKALLPLLMAAPARAYCESLEHPRLSHPAGHSRLANLRQQGVCLRRTKTALNAFTIHLAYDLRHTKIKVNSASSRLGQDRYGADPTQ